MLRTPSKLFGLRLLDATCQKPTTSWGVNLICKVKSVSARCCYSSISTNERSSPLTDAHVSRKNTDLNLFSAKLKLPISTSAQSFSTTRPSHLFSKGNAAIPDYDPEKGRLVYVGTLSNMVKLVKGFSVSTSLIGLCLQPVIFANAATQSLVLQIALGGTLSFFIFLTPLMLHYITKRYITKLYYNTDTGVFTATSLTFFVNEKDTQFKQTDVTLPEIPGFFTTVKVKGQPVFVDPSLFLNREGYIKLMGYDKPIDWRLPGEEKKD